MVGAHDAMVDAAWVILLYCALFVKDNSRKSGKAYAKVWVSVKRDPDTHVPNHGA